MANIDDRPGADFTPCSDPFHVDGCPCGAGGDAEFRLAEVWCSYCADAAVVNQRIGVQIIGRCSRHDPDQELAVPCPNCARPVGHRADPSHALNGGYVCSPAAFAEYQESGR